MTKRSRTTHHLDRRIKLYSVSETQGETGYPERVRTLLLSIKGRIEQDTESESASDDRPADRAQRTTLLIRTLPLATQHSATIAEIDGVGDYDIAGYSLAPDLPRGRYARLSLYNRED